MIDTIIFDYGGVITGAKRSESFSSWAHTEFDVDKAAVNALFSGEHFESYMRGQLSQREFFAPFQRLGVTQDAQLLARQLVGFNEPVPRMRRMIEKLSGGYDLCLVSDSTPELSDDVRRRFGKVFRVVIFSDEHGYIKDDGVLYDIAVAEIGTDLSRCVYVDDREEKLHHLGERGVHCLHFTEPGRFAADLISICGERAERLLKEVH